MANKVTIDIEAKDKASATFEKIKGLIESATFKGTVLGNVFSSAVTGGIGLAQNALEKLTGQLQKAIDTEIAMVSATSSIGAALKIPWEQAEKMNLSLSKQLELLSNDLPGSAQDYIGLLRLTVDDIAAGTNALGLGLEGFEKKVLSIAPKMTILAQSAGVSTDMAAATISKFMSGSSGMGELMRLDFFQKNTRLRMNLEKFMKESGIEQLGEIDVGKRFQLLEKIINESLDDRTLKELSGTLSGTWEGFLGSLFGEQTGILSIMRDLDGKKEGVQSVFSEIKVLAITVLGKDGLFSSLGQLLQILGINTDIMPQLRQGITNLNQFFIGVNQYLGGFTSGISSFVSFRPERLGIILGTLITDVFSGLVSSAPSIIDTVVEYAITGIQIVGATLESIGGSKFGTLVGDLVTKIAQGALRIVPYAVNGLVKAANFLVDAIVPFIAGIDWGGLLVGLGNALSRIDWGSLGVATLKVIGVLVIGGIVGFFGSLIGGFTLLVGGVILGIVAIVAANGDTIKSAISNLGSTLYTGIVGFFEFVLNFESKIRNFVFAALENTVILVTKIFSSIADKLQQAINFVSQIPVIGSTIRAGSAIAGAIAPKADGHIPSGLLMSALSESRKMPSGSRLLLANSSEAILNKGQQTELAGQLRNTQNSSTLHIGSINVYGSSNPETTADLVLAKIKEQYQQSRLTYATPNY